MERLTKYDEFGNAELIGIDNTKLYERLVCDETVALTIATNKLAKLEDVLEKYNIENLEEATTHYDALVEENNTFLMENLKMAGELKDLRKQLAISELELVLNNFKNRPAYFDVARQELCLSDQDKQFIDFIDNQIKSLKGEE